MARKRKTRSGHFCYLCLKFRPNEQFSGKGHHKHECKSCLRTKSKQEISTIRTSNFLYGLLDQSRISENNIGQLRLILETVEDDITRSLAELVLEIATIRPGKRRRFRFLAENHPDLYIRLCRLFPDSEEAIHAAGRENRPEGWTKEMDEDHTPEFDECPADEND